MVLNIIDVTFLFLGITYTLLGILVNHFKEFSPAYIYKVIFYGSFAYKGSEAQSLRHVEVPKAYFSHFYMFAAVFSNLSLFYLVLVFFFDVDVNDYVRFVLRAFLQEDDTVTVITALAAMFLFTIQCTKRMYETLFVQVFAKSNKINISLYVVGFIHYGLCIISIVGKAPLFNGNLTRKNMPWIDFSTIMTVIPSALLFLWATYEQHRSNIILANLRKSKDTGTVVTEAYKVPRGRLFTYVSSPHRLCEILIYVAMAMMLQTKTFVCILVWVVGNQIQGAVAAHQWYKKTFTNYPEDRYAIIPYLL